MNLHVSATCRNCGRTRELCFVIGAQPKAVEVCDKCGAGVFILSSPTVPEPQAETEECPLCVDAVGGVFVQVPPRCGIRPAAIMEDNGNRFLYWRFNEDGVIDEHPFAWRAWWCPECRIFCFLSRARHCPTGHAGLLEPITAKCAVMRRMP
jgi:hypothetical protein